MSVDEFNEWFYSADHRRKYSVDHPAYLSAREAWQHLSLLPIAKEGEVIVPESDIEIYKFAQQSYLNSANRMKALEAFYGAVMGWRERDRESHFSRWTAETIASEGKEAYDRQIAASDKGEG